MFRIASLVIFLLYSGLADQPVDTAYSEKIKEYTTDTRFLNEIVDHIPFSQSVPSPLDYFGHIVGTPDILHYTKEIYGYINELDDATDRVIVRKIGETEENRDMIEVILADEKTVENIETYRLA